MSSYVKIINNLGFTVDAYYQRSTDTSSTKVSLANGSSSNIIVVTNKDSIDIWFVKSNYSLFGGKWTFGNSWSEVSRTYTFSSISSSNKLNFDVGTSAYWTITPNTYSATIKLSSGSSPHGYVAFSSPEYHIESTSDSYTASKGTSVKFRATSYSNYDFVKWTDSSGSTDTSNPKTISVSGAETYTASWKLKTYTIRTYGNNGTISGKDYVDYVVSYGGTTGVMTSATRDPSSKNYTANFYLGNTYLFSRSIPYIRSYIFNGYSSEDGKYTNVTKIDSVTSDYKLYAQWTNVNGSGTISDFPTYSKDGYSFDGWYTDPTSGTKVSASTKFDSDVNLYAVLTPNTYQVTYNKRSDESWEGETPASSELRFVKTFGVPVDIISNKIVRWGYTFKGWCEQSNITQAHSDIAKYRYAVGDQLDDKIYAANNYQGSVNLYPWLDPINCEVHFKYYTNDGTYHEEENETYNIETTFNQGLPFKYSDPKNPFVTGDNDYTFLGWTLTKPEGDGWVWGDDSDKGKGLFLNPEDANFLDPVNPLEIYTNKNTEWGTNAVYYGLWTKTGKYAKTSAGWKKISTAYVATQESDEKEPSFKTITDVYVMTEDGWKHEI